MANCSNIFAALSGLVFGSISRSTGCRFEFGSISATAFCASRLARNAQAPTPLERGAAIERLADLPCEGLIVCLGENTGSELSVLWTHVRLDNGYRRAAFDRATQKAASNKRPGNFPQAACAFFSSKMTPLATRPGTKSSEIRHAFMSPKRVLNSYREHPKMVSSSDLFGDWVVHATPYYQLAFQSTAISIRSLPSSPFGTSYLPALSAASVPVDHAWSSTKQKHYCNRF